MRSLLRNGKQWRVGRLRLAIFLVAFGGCEAGAASHSLRRTGVGRTTPRVGCVLVSDVDDTIKNTGVTIGRTHLKNYPWILLDPVRPWRPVQGMPELYQRFQKKLNAQFLYVSKAPPFSRGRLECNLWRYHYPMGEIRLNASFPLAPANYKFVAIAPIISQSTRGHFILIGDSGETDPENYGMLARKYPRQVDRILIRSVTEDPQDRFIRAFRDVPRSKWTVFSSPKSIRFLSASGTSVLRKSPEIASPQARSTAMPRPGRTACRCCRR
jgi:phosphatidate phosphatase APP1